MLTEIKEKKSHPTCMDISKYTRPFFSFIELFKMLSLSIRNILVFVDASLMSTNITEGEDVINSWFIISCGATDLKRQGAYIRC